MTVGKALWRVVRPIVLTLAALVLFVEEWGWRPLSAWIGRLAEWPPLARIEARIRASSPRVALMLFLVPAVALIPVKVFALWLIHGGHTAGGLAVIVLAKLLGTGLVGRLYVLAQPQLLTFPAFARALAWWIRTKQRVKAALRRSALGKNVRRWRVRVRALLRAL